ncbi:MAG: DUF2345 domain-containing protein [Rhizobacter sp.]|nr:DUF2345 domain-containing protein [Rhizobacter sp.]
MPKTIPSFPHIPIAGGAGTVPAWGRADLMISAPGGVVTATPANAVLSAAQTIGMAAGQDINLQSQRRTSVAVKGGLSLFTYGKAQNADKPNSETGMQLHAASGSVSVQAQANALSLTADKAVAVSSVTDAITMGAPQHVLLAAGGSSIRIGNGAITLTTTGPAQFKAAMKELTSGASASTALSLPRSLQLYDEQFVILDEHTGEPLAHLPYRVENAKGDVVAEGITDERGLTRRVTSSKSEVLKLFY